MQANILEARNVSQSVHYKFREPQLTALGLRALI